MPTAPTETQDCLELQQEQAQEKEETVMLKCRYHEENKDTGATS